ncbi:MAG: hypothetical protein NW208_15685 [Bryobacter sp.]|nr:hypothetical protein [Bryobacter sp.]
MFGVVYILLGWLLTVFAAWGWGWPLLHGLRLEGERNTLALYRFLLGAATLSLLVFVLACAGLVYKASIYGVLAVGIALLLWRRPQFDAVRGSRSVWVYAAFGLYYFAYALHPEMSPDGMSYHLGLVARYAREHGFQLVPGNLYAHLSQGLEMLFLAAYSIGRHSAAALVHFTFLLLLPPLLALHAGRTGWYAGLFVFLLPLAGLDGVSAYNDIALTGVGVAVVDAMVRWQRSQQAGSEQPQWVSVAALLAGFGFGIKYTGALLALLLLPAWRHWPRWAWGGLLSLPWLAKNFYFTGNPLAPFFNHWFPNPYFTEELETSYRAFLRHYDVAGVAEWLREVVLGGPRLSGFLGPAGLLLALGLVALGASGWRTLLGRWWMAGLLATLSIYPLNIGTRFLLPAAPFLALPLFQAAGTRQVWLLAIAALFALPPLRSAYSSPHTWNFDRLEWRAALRLDSEESYLVRKRPGYITARTIEVFVPPGETVFALSPVAESYTSRNVLVSYQSKLGMELLHALAAFRYEGYQARAVYHCPANRIVVGRASNDTWSINGIQPRPRGMTCNRMPWDVGQALDGNWATRWRTWGPVRAGDYCELQGAGPWKLHATADQWDVELAGCTREILPDSEATKVDYRAEARRFFLAQGIRYLAVDAVDYPSADLRDNTASWQVELVAERGAMRIYRWKEGN